MSQDAAMARPPPRAAPLIAPTTGFVHSRIEWYASLPPRLLRQYAPGSGAPALRSLRSAPAQKARPSPVRTTALISSMSLSRSNMVGISAIIWLECALTGGLSSLTRAMCWSITSHLTVFRSRSAMAVLSVGNGDREFGEPGIRI